MKPGKQKETSEIERRFFENIEIRAEEDDDGQKISGYAAVFDRDSVDMGFIEKIQRGAFTDSIKKDDVVALFNHDSSLVLGRTSAKTLTLEEDKKGLRFSVNLDDTTIAKDLFKFVGRGDVKGASFGFRTLEDKWETDKEGEVFIRTILKAQLFDVSPATFPAYPDTFVAVRSRDLWLQQQKAVNSPWRRNLARRRLDLVELEQVVI